MARRDSGTNPPDEFVAVGSREGLDAAVGGGCVLVLALPVAAAIGLLVAAHEAGWA